MYVGFIAEIKKLVFMVWPIEIQFTTHAAPRQQETAAARVTGYFNGRLLALRSW